MAQKAQRKTQSTDLVRTINLTDFNEEAMMDVIDSAAFRHRLLGEPLRRFSHRRILLPRCIVDSGSYNAPVLVEGAFSEHVLTFGMTIDGPVQPSIYGHDVKIYDLQVYGEATELLYIGPAHTRWAACEVTRETVQHVARTLLGHELVLPNRARYVNLTGIATVTHDLSRLLARLVDLPLDSLRTAGKQIEDRLLSGIVRSIAAAQSGYLPDRNGHATPHDAHELRRAVAGQLDGPYSSLACCETLGITERTLERRFHEFYQMSPRRWHLLERLHRARRDLTAARSNTVTRVAMRWGFTHLGRFSREYANLFGERPSDTIRAA